ncbi:MAG: putative manganese-dependent inorganic diphosphatase [Solirubrobacterales bacterium]
MNRNTVIVIGHRNPDLDSVASAIAYARLKNDTGEYAASPGVAGDLNRETAFVLERLGIESPRIIQDLKARVEDLLDEEPWPALRPEATCFDAADLVRSRGVKTIPICDAKGRLLGILTAGDLALTFMNHLTPDLPDAQAAGAVRAVWQMPVSSMMKKDQLLTFDQYDPVDEARQTMLKSRFRNYPVVDENNRFLGMISRYHLLNLSRKKVILVDHNEKKQSLEGIEEAEIIEIIDHHRLGDLQSINPILFRNEPIGATSTLVSELYRSAGSPPERPVAGLLLAGILSDTMIFRSPTTTNRDRAAAQWLAEISGLQIEKLGRDIVREASPVDVSDPVGLITGDLKEYSFNDANFAVAQVETGDMTQLENDLPALREALETLQKKQGFDLIFLMITDIFIGGTKLLIFGEQSAFMREAISGGFEAEPFIDGMMSRKKQLVPLIFQALARQELM